jgi:tRNA (guanosine-2'-O-)-methyltransferase
MENLIEHLSQFVAPRRLELFERILEQRTRYLTVVLEDIYQSHNASAVLRSCECFGIQDVHIIENQNAFTLSPDITLGSNKWLTLSRYNLHTDNTREAIETLRSKGYRIVATTPHKNDLTLDDFDPGKGKTALLFGSELTGLSETALQMADEYVRIPMAGFTESLNISVTAALFVHHLTQRIRALPVAWQLTQEEKNVIKIEWLKNSIKKSSLIVDKFINNQRINKNGTGTISSEQR